MRLGKRSRISLIISMGFLTIAGVLMACGSSNNSNSGAVVTGTSGSKSTPTTNFKVGQAVKIGNTWIVTVNSFKTTPGDDITAPAAGNEFVAVDVSIKNVSGSDQSISSILNFTFRDSTGQSYTETVVDNLPSTPDGNVSAGQQIRGTIAYEVPKAQKHFTLAFQADITSSGQAVWDLSL